MINCSILCITRFIGTKPFLSDCKCLKDLMILFAVVYCLLDVSDGYCICMKSSDLKICPLGLPRLTGGMILISLDLKNENMVVIKVIECDRSAHDCNCKEWTWQVIPFICPSIPLPITR